MDELASTLLNRINGLAKKALKSGENFNDEQHRMSLVRITENVRLIKRIEKVTDTDLDSDDDDDVDTSVAPRRGRKSTPAPSASA